MYRPTTSKTQAAQTPSPVSASVIRAGLGLAVLTALSAFAFRAGAQTMSAISRELRPIGRTAPAISTTAQSDAPLVVAVAAAAPSTAKHSAVIFTPVPFAVGEELVYKATFGILPAGTARMRVDGIEMVRGHPAYHVIFSIDGGVPFFRVRDRYESWIDVQTLASLRHRQQISEGRYSRNTTYEIFPERASFQKDDEPVQASVPNPLDDGSFVYAIRAAHVRVGETRHDDRYFRPDRNPVILTGLRQESLTVNAGTFATTVVHPSIKANGIFSENGDAQIWFSDDAARIPVQVKTKFSKFSLTLALQSVTPGDASAHPRLVVAAMNGQ
jgi:hypothetical protein